MIEWSLKTVLAPWAYLASVAYHDSFWYPTHQQYIHEILKSEWGRLFQNWDDLAIPPDDLEARGWEFVGNLPAELKNEGIKFFLKSLRILGLCVREAPEFAAKKRRRQQPVLES